MRRWQWDDLPPTARAAVEDRFGTVTSAWSAEAGLTVGVAARLHAQAGSLFLKAVPVRSPALHHYDREQQANLLLPEKVPAPRMLWSGHAAGWLMLLFEYVAGREADLTPGSPDIPAVLDAVAGLGEALTPCPWQEAPSIEGKILGMRGYADKLLADPRDAGIGLCASALDLLDVEALTGDTLLHADLHAENVLITPTRARIIDWSLACRGAAWVDAVWLVPRLIAAGHTPREAEHQVAARVPAWHAAPATTVTGLAGLRTLFSTYMAINGPEHLRARRTTAAAAARAWVEYRCR
ncbi:phosphotransferase family protein [Sphaerimonospora mesophila]|uniref:phosphotransferase family protein n=1 Tax=Sphaerimonospora mesophila TaxID=37483 RepID=UPI0006E39DAA